MSLFVLLTEKYLKFPAFIFFCVEQRTENKFLFLSHLYNCKNIPDGEICGFNFNKAEYLFNIVVILSDPQIKEDYARSKSSKLSPQKSMEILPIILTNNIHEASNPQVNFLKNQN